MRLKSVAKAQDFNLGEPLLTLAEFLLKSVVLAVLSYNYSVMRMMFWRDLFALETPVPLNAAHVS